MLSSRLVALLLPQTLATLLVLMADPAFARSVTEGTRWPHLEIQALNVRTFGLRDGEVEILVTARDVRGLGRIEVECAGTSIRVSADNRKQLTTLVRCKPSPAAGRETVFHAVAVSTDGRLRGTPMVKRLLQEDHAGEMAPPWAHRKPQRLVDTTYPARVGAFDNWAAELTPVTNELPWWKHWSNHGARHPFKYESQCAPGIGGVSSDGQVLRCWLELNPQVRKNIVWHDWRAKFLYYPDDLNPDLSQVTNKAIAYDDWTDEMKIQLDQAVYWYWSYLQNGADFFSGEYIPDVLENQALLEDDWNPETVASHGDAWKLYLGTIAHSLALEIGGFVPWSVVKYTDADLQNLFHSDTLFRAGLVKTYYYGSLYGYRPRLVLAAPPATLFDILLSHDIIRPTAYATVGRFIEWGHNGHLYHQQTIPGVCPPNATLCNEMMYGYRGTPPVARLMQGTSYTQVTPPYLTMGPAGWVPGCHGMAELASLVLRTVNIPVDGVSETIDGVKHTRSLGATQHSIPFFWTIGMTLSHGDDVYTAGNDSTPPFPGHWLLLPLATYEDWFFGSGKLGADGYANVGRQAHIEVPLRALSDELLQRYCADQASSLAHTDGSVAAFFRNEAYGVTYYDVAQLEALNLWGKLGAKAKTLGFCGP